jgi:heparosan-N-sulfate-glucuronate 5-epimerase
MNTSQPGPFRRAFRELSMGYSSMVGRTVDFAPQSLGRHIDTEGLGGYYCDLRHKATHTIDGLPSNSFGEQDYLWVIPIAQAALGYWDLRIEGREVDRDFLYLADWLMDHSEPGPGGIVWRNDFAVPKYALEPGWTSAMGQSQAISVLLRAHMLTDRGEYIDAAHGARGSLLLPVSAGGTQATIDGVPVLEEYPTKEPSAVLNGWIFALFGLHELAVVTADSEARDLFQRSAAGLVKLLPRYDNGWWSLYSLHDHGRPDLAKPFYQRLHPELLEALALIYPAAPLNAYAKRWRDQHSGLAIARASLNKLFFRVYRTLR